MKLKRIYDQPTKTDNIRILVDRVWPRGVSKKAAKLDLWLKEIGPSPSLRKWFGHDPEKFATFRTEYLQELRDDGEKREALAKLKDCYEEHNGEITLLFATKELEYNHVMILKELLET
ncbi:DUF488 domain-containing protein [Gracilibacillus salinarum]|uniref:DUF488 family protein n=1 Tax=Gracilibacillus salinarum TaxID=2932255 RepID=A0ABY4GHB4_9BACI|nr:DUF488 family protein [Gracilibacillus salinarum]UOQ83604.1 DUF488 family protein [Gracilibacillus salinarum]